MFAHREGPGTCGDPLVVGADSRESTWWIEMCGNLAVPSWPVTTPGKMVMVFPTFEVVPVWPAVVMCGGGVYVYMIDMLFVYVCIYIYILMRYINI